MRRKKKLPKVGGWGFPVWVGLACMDGASLYWWVSCGWGFPVWVGILMSGAFLYRWVSLWVGLSCVGGVSLCGWGFPCGPGQSACWMSLAYVPVAS